MEGEGREAQKNPSVFTPLRLAFSLRPGSVESLKDSRCFRVSQHFTKSDLVFLFSERCRFSEAGGGGGGGDGPPDLWATVL